jgi:DNA-binding HxlR family transcriptional regulator
METEPLDHKRCMGVLLPVRDALDVINGKWKIQIIIAITNGNCRFKDIERQIPGISPRMLSKELKDLECHQLIKREVFDSLPVSVTYRATSHARTLGPLITALKDWGLLHRKKIINRKNPA